MKRLLAFRDLIWLTVVVALVLWAVAERSRANSEHRQSQKTASALEESEAYRQLYAVKADVLSDQLQSMYQKLQSAAGS